MGTKKLNEHIGIKLCVFCDLRFTGLCRRLYRGAPASVQVCAPAVLSPLTPRPPLYLQACSAFLSQVLATPSKMKAFPLPSEHLFIE